MRKLLLVILIACSGPVAKAEPFAALGTSLAFEQSPDGRTIETRQPFAVRGGYRFRMLDVYLDYQTYSASQGTELVRVGRTHHEWVMSARRIFFKKWKARPYGALGLGVQHDVVETTLGEEEARDVGLAQAVLAASLGVQVKVWKSFDLQFESRLATSQNYSPNPLLSLIFLGGWSF